MQEPLSSEQEAQAQELAAQISAAIASDVLALARLLVSRTGKHTFGQTEFQLRDLVHRAGAKALETSLAQKKRLRRLRTELPPLRSIRPLQGLSDPQAGELAGDRSPPPRLLPLRRL